ncbi:hypothetical protein [Lactobacillus pentosus] [Lactiplantibacillus mudanjiangensis]|uniref:toxin Cry1Ac domain D-VI-related protein n=1 Tax=Lactiplantibacillus mudanjiangensis TaxID=1296538 RepID=UPI001014683C|nr:toxin Cry1Ac domain D-VI-related protein [Lactiplantibacillus mudanjiangensis]VDG31482.1 hypothetical protein [Lactobacillus pentosus] [Lactiplantibacillus mudanjiangensis]
MKKGLVIVGIILSGVLLLAGCGKSASEKEAASSIASSKKESKSIARMESEVDASSEKKEKEDLSEAEGAVDNLFAEKENTDSESFNYNKLFTGIGVSDVENVQHQVNKLPNSAKKTKLQKLISKAMAMAKGEEPTQTSSESKAESASLARQRSESTKKEIASISDSTERSASKKTSSTSATAAYKKSIRQFVENSTEYGINSVSFPTKEVHYYVDSSYADASDSTKKEIGTYLFNHTTKIGDMCDISVRPIYVYTTGGTLIARSTLTGGIKAE